MMNQIYQRFPAMLSQDIHDFAHNEAHYFLIKTKDQCFDVRDYVKCNIFKCILPQFSLCILEYCMRHATS